MAQQFTGLPMDDLIGAPLMAAARANNKMAGTQTKFILDTCFYREKVTSSGPDSRSLEATEGENSDDTPMLADDSDNQEYTYTPIMITMSLTRGVLQPAPAPTDTTPNPQPTIENFTTTFRLPLLTILPLNSLAVDNVDVKFNMEVKSSFSDATSESTNKKLATTDSFEAKVGYGIFSASVKGSVSYNSESTTNHSTHYSKSNSANYTVAVHAGQIPLPPGVTTIINAFANAITPITLPAPAKPKTDKLEATRTTRRVSSGQSQPQIGATQQQPLPDQPAAEGEIITETTTVTRTITES